MKKVDLIHAGWLNAPNGASSVLRSFYNNLEIFEKNEVSLDFFTMDSIKPKFTNTKNTDDKNDNFIVEFIKRKSKDFSLFAFITIWGYYIRHARKITKEYVRNNSNNGSDIIFIHDIFTCFYYLKYRRNKKKIVLVLHNNGDTFNMIKWNYGTIEKSLYFKYLLKIENCVISNVDFIGFVAKKPLDNFSKLHPFVETDKLFYVYNGIKSLNNTKPILLERESDKKYRLVCVASISERKGQRVLLEALTQIDKSILSQIELTFVGDGLLRNELEEFVKFKALDENVKFKGVLKDVSGILTSSNIFILPSLDEGFPISILEAMSLKLPIISTNVAGIPEMVKEGYNGYVINPGSLAELKDILNKLPEFNFEELGCNSLEYFNAKFTIEKMISEYSILFKKI
jgi:Glycosyltransferase